MLKWNRMLALRGAINRIEFRLARGVVPRAKGKQFLRIKYLSIRAG